MGLRINVAGTGVSQKALALVIDHLFATYHFNKLFLRTHPTNIAARRVAEKCGFFEFLYTASKNTPIFN